MKRDIPIEQKRVLTAREAASYLGIGLTSLYEAVKVGQIPAFRVGKRLCISRIRLDVMLSGEDILPADTSDAMRLAAIRVQLAAKRAEVEALQMQKDELQDCPDFILKLRGGKP